MEACAEPRADKTPLTWITPKMMHAFWALHEAGYAHSVEVWDDNCRLVGGLYGLAIGGVFFAESRFAREDGASKVGVAVLHQHLAHWCFGVRDAKWMSPHLASLGFRMVDREAFQEMLKEHAWRPSRVGALGSGRGIESMEAPSQSDCPRSNSYRVALLRTASLAAVPLVTSAELHWTLRPQVFP